MSLYTLAVKVNPSFSRHWVSGGRLELLSWGGLFWLIVLVPLGWPIGIALCALYGFLSPLTTLIGLDELSEVSLEGRMFGEAACSECVQWQVPVLSNEESPDLDKHSTVRCWIS